MLPKRLNRIGVPPIKCQGIKTKLVRFISGVLSWSGDGRWIEPFLGSGVVLFNLKPHRARVSDTNPHIISLYRGIQAGTITPDIVSEFLRTEGTKLRRRGVEHYYAVRSRFNAQHDPLDFLFLNRSCFNGMQRFNKQGAFNVPFCHKPDRFRPAYVTKISNQVAWVAQQMQGREWLFEVADWRRTLEDVVATDFVYLDPPYVGRHTDYYNGWTEQEADELATEVKNLAGSWAYSMWLENRYRRNPHLEYHFAAFDILTWEHFYHLGATESLRHAVREALVVSPGDVNREPFLRSEQVSLKI